MSALKKAIFGLLTDYCPVLNLSFLGNVVERVVAEQLQALLKDASILDPVQSSFHPVPVGIHPELACGTEQTKSQNNKRTNTQIAMKEKYLYLKGEGLAKQVPLIT